LKSDHHHPPCGSLSVRMSTARWCGSLILSPLVRIKQIIGAPGGEKKRTYDNNSFTPSSLIG
jgi:hypothetical protein